MEKSTMLDAPLDLTLERWLRDEGADAQVRVAGLQETTLRGSVQEVRARYNRWVQKQIWEAQREARAVDRLGYRTAVLTALDGVQS